MEVTPFTNLIGSMFYVSKQIALDHCTFTGSPITLYMEMTLQKLRNKFQNKIKKLKIRATNACQRENKQDSLSCTHPDLCCHLAARRKTALSYFSILPLNLKSSVNTLHILPYPSNGKFLKI